MRELFDPVVNGLAGVLIDLGLDAVEPKSIVGGATDRSHGDIAIPFHKFAGVLRRPPADIAEEAAGKLSPYLDQIICKLQIGLRQRHSNSEVAFLQISGVLCPSIIRC